MGNVVTGLFNNAADAVAAMHALESKGVGANDISLIANESLSKDNFAITDNSKMPEGVALGATTGGLAAAVFGGLVAIGTIASGGLGLGLVAAGPLVASLAAGGAGAAAGSLIGGAIGLSIPEHEIKYVEDAIEQGSVLVGVNYKNDDIKKLIEETFETFEVKSVSTA